MTITSITPANSGRAQAQAPKTLGQADFLRLLTTQLQTQDPFNPTDNTQMIAQMAQFSQVSGIAEINQSLSSIAAMLTKGQASDLSGWIGKSALVESQTAMPMADGYIRGEVTVPANASGMSIALLNADGSLVAEQAIEPDASGNAVFSFDQPALSSPVTVQLRQNGNPIETQPRVWTSVIALSDPASGNPSLLTTNGDYSAHAVQRLG